MFKVGKVENVSEIDHPIADSQLARKGNFFGIYGGEHIAATEFVIGATLVKWGCTATDILIGLFIGNILAVLAFTFMCAKIATETRLTLYSYIKKILGSKLQKLYNLVWGICCMGLAAAGVSISATAIREVVNIPIQSNWYPTSAIFILIVIIIGVVITLVVANGFETMCKFSNTCVPWMIAIFFVAFFVSIPRLCELTGFGSINSPIDLLRLLDSEVWTGKAANGGKSLGIIHVIAFAFTCNLGWHVGLNDMSMFRFAKNYKYGYISSVGMFVGHFFAWISAGIMGATASVILGSPLVSLDSGSVTNATLGYSGILAVVIAGWTTANPTIYRVALSFNTIFKQFTQKQVTYFIGVVMTILACFPIIQNATSILVWLGLAVVGVGAIVYAEHVIFPKIGYTRYWTLYKGSNINWAAAIAWGATFVFYTIMLVTGTMHENLLGAPAWIISIVIYIVLAGSMGAKESYKEEEKLQTQFDNDLQQYVNQLHPMPTNTLKTSNTVKVIRWISFAFIGGLIISGFLYPVGSIDIDVFKSWSFIMTILYFGLNIVAIVLQSLELKRHKHLCKEELQNI